MMKFINDNLKIIFAFILGMIISGSLVYAYSFQSSDVLHTNSDGTTTSVETALNSLYTLHNSGNALASDILSGKTALSGGSLLTGTMHNYSSSTAQSCTTANTSNKLYVKPVNAGYYSSNSSFNTGINYNPKGTGGAAATSGTTVTTSSTNVTLNGSNLILDSDSKITIPSGYYSSAINVSNGGGSGISAGSFSSTYNSYSRSSDSGEVLLYTFTKSETVILHARLWAGELSGCIAKLRDKNNNVKMYIYNLPYGQVPVGTNRNDVWVLSVENGDKVYVKSMISQVNHGQEIIYINIISGFN